MSRHPVTWRVSVATKYAWTCSRIVKDAECIKGSVKLVLLAIAALVPEHHASTGLVRLSTLVKMTGLEERQVRRCRDFLARLKEIAVETEGKRARYVMVGMAGPLFVASSAEDADKLSGFMRLIERWEAGHPVRVRFDPDKLSAPMSGLAGGVSSFSEDVRTKEHNHYQIPAEIIAQVHALFDWWVATFPLHNGGQPTTAEIDAFGPVATELLTRRRLTVDGIQQRAVAMWSIRDVKVHNWIPTTDYSIRVLRDTADWLGQRLAVVAQQPKPDWNGHLPPCRTNGECIERVLREGREATG